MIALSPDIPFLKIPVRIEDLLMVPLAAGWLAHLCAFRERQRTSLDRLVVAYFLVGLLATAWGGYLGTVHFSELSKEAGASFHLLKRLEFVYERAKRILGGQVSQVVKGLRLIATKRKLTGAKSKTLEQVAGYLYSNRERMRYDVYLANGWPIASAGIACHDGM